MFEPIRELLASDESDVIPCWALDFVESARCGSLNTALRRTAILAAERLHGDTTVPILAKGKTVTGRIWTYVRDGTFSVLEKAAA